MTTINNLEKSSIIIYTDEDFYWYTNKTFLYLLWFQPSLWYIIYNSNELIVILDSRYFDKLKDIDEEDLFDKLNLQRKNDDKIKLKFILKDKKIEEIIKHNIHSRNIIIETSCSLDFYKKLVNYGFDVKSVAPIFEEVRIKKDISEVKSIKKAILIIEKVFRSIERLNKTWWVIWKTEIQIRQYIINKIFEFGWEWESFSAIVAYWKNSAVPHHESWSTKIKTGSVLLVDMWALYKWYASDFTRCMWIWEKDWKNYEEYNNIYSIIKNAQKEGKKIINIPHL